MVLQHVEGYVLAYRHDNAGSQHLIGRPNPLESSLHSANDHCIILFRKRAEGYHPISQRRIVRSAAEHGVPLDGWQGKHVIRGYTEKPQVFAEPLYLFLMRCENEKRPIQRPRQPRYEQTPDGTGNPGDPTRPSGAQGRSDRLKVGNPVQTAYQIARKHGMNACTTKPERTRKEFGRT
jgi:hypothetical protein